jgi:predicted 3-demethylubiquinone-9 3-methyltransferase (glyoxalase superfamily)/predicted enzyme related to lactoylglutathione lyase
MNFFELITPTPDATVMFLKKAWGWEFDKSEKFHGMDYWYCMGDGGKSFSCGLRGFKLGETMSNCLAHVNITSKLYMSMETALMNGAIPLGPKVDYSPHGCCQYITIPGNLTIGLWESPMKGGMPSTRIAPCLWFGTEAEEAANFYVKMFPNSSIMHVSRNGPNGAVDFVTFDLDGRKFTALNSHTHDVKSGRYFKFNEAVSFMVDCQDQKEVDEYWKKISADGGKESECGWCYDKFGLSWQVVPKQLGELFRMAGKDKDKYKRVQDAMMKMKKLDIEGLQRAFDGGVSA